MKLTARQIERLVKQGEVVHTECKDASGGLPDSLWESYSAFANTDGGVILLGAKEVDGKFSITGVQNAAALIKRFWDCVNNREKVSVNILFDRHVYSVKCRGRDVVVIEVPRADRQDRPVYIGKDMFSGSFRRNGEGDYHCPRESVKAMLRDACVETADACLLDELTVDDLCIPILPDLYALPSSDRSWISFQISFSTIAKDFPPIRAGLIASPRMTRLGAATSTTST